MLVIETQAGVTNMTTFKKGELVTHISDWDGNGTVYFYQAVVHSCGKKQMVLTHATTGEEMGRHFAPVAGDQTRGGTFAHMTDEQAKAFGFGLAENILQRERTELERLSKLEAPEGYKNALKKRLANLHGAPGA